MDYLDSKQFLIEAHNNLDFVKDFYAWKNKGGKYISLEYVEGNWPSTTVIE